MFQGIFKSAINDVNKNYIFGTGSIPIQIKTAQLATFADGTTKQQGYQVAEVNKLISTMLTGWDADGNKPKSMSDNYLELILSCDNGFVIKKKLQFPHIIAWQDDSTQYNIADVYKEFSIDNWLKADDFENPDITLVVEPTDEILTTSTANPPEATTEQSGRFYLYYRNLPVGVNRIHIDFHIKTKTEPIDFDLEVIDGLSWKDTQVILASNEQAKINVLLGTVKDVYKFTGSEGDFENITMHEWSVLYQQIINLNPNNKFTHDLFFCLYESESKSEVSTNFNSIQLLPQRKFKKPLVAIKASDKKWTPTVASDANVDNTTREIYDEVYQKMTDVEWVESLNSAFMVYDFPTHIDMSKKVVCGSIYLDEDIADTATMGITWLRLYSSGIDDIEHAIQVQIQWAGAGYENYQRTGWFHFCVCPQVNGNTVGSSFDITDIHKIAIRQAHTSASVKYGIGDFYIVDEMQKGGVVMLIDNFNPNVPSMADYIASKGLKATLSIVPFYIGRDDIHGTLKQINKCAADGHLIINHTWSHNISNDQTSEDIFDEISKADKWMLQNGFARGSKIISNPSAAYDLNKYRAYMSSEALMIYHHWTVMGKDNNFTLYYPYYPMSRLLNITSLEERGVEYMINAVDKAVEVGGIAVLGWHGTWYEKENGEADFKRLIDHIASLGKDCTCYLVDDLIEGTYL